MRTFSANAVAAMFGAQTTKLLVMLLRIKHSTIPEGGILRFVRNDENVTVTNAGTGNDPDRVGEYIAMPFEVILPHDLEGQPARIPLEIVNVDRVIVDTVRRLPPQSPPPTMAIELVLFDSPNTLELTVQDVILRKSEWNAAIVRGEIAADEIYNEPFPARFYTPTSTPGLFRVPVAA